MELQQQQQDLAAVTATGVSAVAFWQDNIAHCYLPHRDALFLVLTAK